MLDRFLHLFGKDCTGSDRLYIPKRTSFSNYTGRSTSRLSDLCDLAVRSVCVSDTELSNCSHFSGHPTGKDFAPLFLAEARAREVALGNKGNNINYDLVLVQNGVNNDRDDRSEIRSSHYFYKDNHKAPSLEDGTKLILVTACRSVRKETRLTIHQTRYYDGFSQSSIRYP